MKTSKLNLIQIYNHLYENQIKSLVKSILLENIFKVLDNSF